MVIIINDSFRKRYRGIPAATYLKENFEDTLLHNHRELEIILVESGSSFIRVGGKEQLCHTGDVVFVNPMEIHSVKIKRDEAYRHKCICFDTSLIIDTKIAEELASENMRFDGFVPASESKARLSGLICAAYDSINEASSAASSIEIRAYISLIAAHMIKLGRIGKCTYTDRTERFNSDVQSYISEHFHEEISSHRAAENLCYSHAYFCRRFHSGFGMNFSEYLNIFRITRARQLIEDTSEKLSVIAESCGFSDPVYFTKCFKRYIGVTPSEYRKRSIQD